MAAHNMGGVSVVLVLCLLHVCGADRVGPVVPQQYATPYFTHLDCHQDPPNTMDMAMVTIVPYQLPATGHLVLYGQTNACWKCPLVELIHINDKKNCTFLADSRFTVRLVLGHRINTSADEKNVWGSEEQLQEHSQYIMWVSSTSGSTIVNLYPDKIAMDGFIPIYVAMVIFLLLSLLWMSLRYLYRKSHLNPVLQKLYPTLQYIDPEVEDRRGLVGADQLEESSDFDSMPTDGSHSMSEVTSQRSRSQRLKSLDTFRGLSLTIMIFVNYGGGGYWFFAHSFWNGLTVADLVFPWFIWIIGTSIALSFDKLLQRGTSRLTLTLKVIKRTAIIFGLGLVLNSSAGTSFVDLHQLRIPGVLQRLAVSYCVVALLQVICARPNDPYADRRWAPIRDILGYWLEWVVMAGLVAIHLVLIFLLQVKGCPRGYLGPGGLHDGGQHWNCTGGAYAYIDRLVFGLSHIYQRPTCHETYHTLTAHDPEGILGTPTSIFMCFLGLQAGKILLLFPRWSARTIRWVLWAVIQGLIAGILCNFSQNDGWIPLNKNLWSLSFTLGLSSMAFLLLTALHAVIDMCKIWTGSPFYYPGMNSIAVYMCHEILHRYFPISWQVPLTHATLLPLHLWGAAFWTAFAAVLYYKKIFIII